MSDLRFLLTDYDEAFYRFSNEVLLSFQNLEPLLANFPALVSEHCGPIRNVRGDVPLDQPLEAIRFEAPISPQVIRNCDIEGYVEFLSELSQKRLEAIGPQFFDKMNVVVEAVGNSVDAGGEYTYTTYLKAIEQIEISFDEDGKPLMPELYGHPDTIEKIRKCQPTEEEKNKLLGILERKRREYFAQKRTRRLS